MATKSMKNGGKDMSIPKRKIKGQVNISKGPKNVFSFFMGNPVVPGKTRMRG